jgi:hypothetical protein
MTTFTLIIAIIAGMLAAYTFIATLTLNDRLINTEEGLRECATRTSSNKLHIDTLKNKVDKPKAKRGRPRKNTPKPHVLNGVQ